MNESFENTEEAQEDMLYKSLGEVIVKQNLNQPVDLSKIQMPHTRFHPEASHFDDDSKLDFSQNNRQITSTGHHLNNHGLLGGYNN